MKMELEYEELRIKKFNIKSVQPGDCCLVIGPPKSGKTYLIKHIMNINKDIRNVNTMNGEYESGVVNDVIREYGDRILVCDNCQLESRSELHKLFLNKKYSDIMVLIAIEDGEIPVVIRNNVDYIFLTTMSLKYINIVYNKFKIGFMKNQLRFYEIVKKILSDDKYTAVVLDIQTGQIFWYKAA